MKLTYVSGLVYAYNPSLLPDHKHYWIKLGSREEILHFLPRIFMELSALTPSQLFNVAPPLISNQFSEHYVTYTMVSRIAYSVNDFNVISPPPSSYADNAQFLDFYSKGLSGVTQTQDVIDNDFGLVFRSKEELNFPLKPIGFLQSLLSSPELNKSSLFIDYASSYSEHLPSAMVFPEYSGKDPITTVLVTTSAARFGPFSRADLDFAFSDYL